MTNLSEDERYGASICTYLCQEGVVAGVLMGERNENFDANINCVIWRAWVI